LNAQVIQNSEELMFGNVTILGDVKVLEDWLQVHALSVDGLAEMS
jgi:hypothetical protein